MNSTMASIRRWPHWWPYWLLVGLVLGAAAPRGFAQEEEPELTPPRPRPNTERMREEALKLSPDQRQQRFLELREQYGLAGTNRLLGPALREELRSLPPEERAQRLRQLRQQFESGGPGFRVLTPEEREAKRKEVRERVEAEIKALETKKTEGTITEVEQRRLGRMKDMVNRLSEGRVLGPRAAHGAVLGKPAGLPPPAATPAK